MTIEEAIAAVHERGYLVNNLFQLDDGIWVASLRDKGLARQPKTYQFSRGLDPADALRRALPGTADAAKGDTPREARLESPEPEPAGDTDDDLI